VDRGHNFVLADDRCNSAKGVMPAALPYRTRWTERNAELGAVIVERCTTANVRADLAASTQIVPPKHGSEEDSEDIYAVD